MSERERARERERKCENEWEREREGKKIGMKGNERKKLLAGWVEACVHKENIQEGVTG